MNSEISKPSKAEVVDSMAMTPNEFGVASGTNITVSDELVKARKIMDDVHSETADFRTKKQICAAIGHIDGAISRLVEVGS